MPTCPPLDVVTVRASVLAPGGLWTRLEWTPTTGSTNADVASWAREGVPSGAVLVSEHQSTGRGRLARVWEAPPGTSLAISLLVRPRSRQARWSWLPLLTGCAMADALVDAGLDAALKWPNDVLVGGRKICGILAERVDAGGSPAAVIGVGLNVSMDADELPVPTATSVRLAGSPASKDELVVAFLNAFAARYGAWDAGADLRAAYESRCASIGRSVRVLVDADTSVDGVAVGVDEAGQLIVRTACGQRTFAAGDVVHLR